MCGEIAAVKVKIPFADFDFSAAPISPLVGAVAMSGDAQGVGERRRQELTGGQGNSDLSGQRVQQGIGADDREFAAAMQTERWQTP